VPKCKIRTFHLLTFVESRESRTLCCTRVVYSLSLTHTHSLTHSLIHTHIHSFTHSSWSVETAETQEPVARISDGIPNRRGNPRHLEIDGARFRCNWRHRVRVTLPTSSPTSRSRMYIGYIERTFRAAGRDGDRGIRDDKGSPRIGDSRTSQPRYANRYVVPNMPAIICKIDNGYLRMDHV